jgi:hypothetical protein
MMLYQMYEFVLVSGGFIVNVSRDIFRVLLRPWFEGLMRIMTNRPKYLKFIATLFHLRVCPPNDPFV